MATHRFSLLPTLFAVVRLESGDPVPPWALDLQGFSSVTRTPDELSIVAPELNVPSEARAERGWRALQLHGPFPFEQVGVLASFATHLAQHHVSIFALSTYDTDFILVKASPLTEAISALEAAGHIYVR